MADTAAYLADSVLIDVPVRQWVLTLPMWLRRAVARDSRLCARILKIFTGQLARHLKSVSRSDGHFGSVTVIQRFGGALNLNPHFHTLVPDGLYFERGDGQVYFRQSPPPSLDQLQHVLGTIIESVRRLLARMGYHLAELIDQPVAWHACLDASIGQRQLLGDDAGLPMETVGESPTSDTIRYQQHLCAKLAGFTLHAGVTTDAKDRGGLERLCRYIARPAIAQDRLSTRHDGKVVYRLRHPWRDGTSQVIFDPLDFIAHLAALIPPPRTNLVRYHGVFAPAAKLRSRIVGQTNQTLASAMGHKAPGVGKTRVRRNLLWAELMSRVFGINVLTCPECGGQCRVIACIEDPAVIRKILRHLGLPTQGATLHPARGPPDHQLDFVDVV
jgi:hypothetical protein